MAEPTMQDVLDAIVALSAKTDALGAKTDALGAKADALGAKTDALGAKTDRLETELRAVRSDVQDVRSDVQAHRSETARGFAQLDGELTKHAERAHRELEDEIAAIKRRLPPKKTPAPRVRRR